MFDITQKRSQEINGIKIHQIIQFDVLNVNLCKIFLFYPKVLKKYADIYHVRKNRRLM